MSACTTGRGVLPHAGVVPQSSEKGALGEHEARGHGDVQVVVLPAFLLPRRPLGTNADKATPRTAFWGVALAPQGACAQPLVKRAAALGGLGLLGGDS